MDRKVMFYVLIFLCVGLNVAAVDSLYTIQDIVQFNVEESKVGHGQANNFQYNNCGHPESDVFNLTSLAVSPDPIQLPGTVTISAGMKFRVAGASPIKMEVAFYKKLGESWLKIPCVAEVGSCTYGDICDILDLIPVCPQQLVQAHIPCKCPFAQGTYTLPESKFFVPLPLVPGGDYRIKSVFTNDHSPGACIELLFSIN
ncbi:ganglioside GM2 activator [Elysia marginata]|uniref:Ganglioside GM2 activator n=1 Tax=Elysia marginata TaxID=1093978 RepID=A0AAV4IU81_9GAST|nr:ganglioside GM2 activator [Elysia marginata]